jgi:hypothetical protein
LWQRTETARRYGFKSACVSPCGATTASARFTGIFQHDQIYAESISLNQARQYRKNTRIYVQIVRSPTLTSRFGYDGLLAWDLKSFGF